MSGGNSYFVIRRGYEGDHVRRVTREEAVTVLDQLPACDAKACASWDEWRDAGDDDVLIIRGDVVPVRAVEVVKKWELP